MERHRIVRENRRRQSFVDMLKYLAALCHFNRFCGCEVLRHLKVRVLTDMYCEDYPDWSWLPGNCLKVDDEFVPAVFLLDLHYRLTEDRGDASRMTVNRMFLMNCIKCVRMRTWWFSPRRYALLFRALTDYRTVCSECVDMWKAFRV